MNGNPFTEADDTLIRTNIGRRSFAAIGRLCSPPRTVDAVKGALPPLAHRGRPCTKITMEHLPGQCRVRRRGQDAAATSRGVKALHPPTWPRPNPAGWKVRPGPGAIPGPSLLPPLAYVAVRPGHEAEGDRTEKT